MLTGGSPMLGVGGLFEESEPSISQELSSSSKKEECAPNLPCKVGGSTIGHVAGKRFASLALPSCLVKSPDSNRI